jgi:sporulation protein YlmC with PRC-barrel domain
MEQIKHKNLPFEETIDTESLIGMKVMSSDGKNIGKVKSLHLHPKDLTVEGFKVDPGWFEADHYIGGNYVDKITKEAIILSMVPATEYVGLIVNDEEGKKVGVVKSVNRSNRTNKLISLMVESDHHEEDLQISSDYISVIGHSVMLKLKLEDIKK